VLGILVLTIWLTLRLIFDYGDGRAHLPLALTLTELAKQGGSLSTNAETAKVEKFLARP